MAGLEDAASTFTTSLHCRDGEWFASGGRGCSSAIADDSRSATTYKLPSASTLLSSCKPGVCARRLSTMRSHSSASTGKQTERSAITRSKRAKIVFHGT